MWSMWLRLVPVVVVAVVALVVAEDKDDPPRVLFDTARETSGDRLDACQYLLKNITSVDTLQQHEFAALERCLYYYLAGEASRRMARLGIPHPIAAVPPNYISRKPVDVHFHQVTLQHFELNEFLRDISIHGYIEMNWMDERLTWPVNVWKTESLRIQSLNHVWVPVLTAQNIDTALRNGDAFELRKIETSSRGNVSALLAFSLRTFCDDSDFSNYPEDTYKCCFALEPHNNQDIIEFSTDNMPIYTDPKYFRDYGWKISGTVPQIVEENQTQNQLGFCLNLTRASPSVRIELTVPLIACAILFLITPFIGPIKIQIFVKVFLLSLQFLALILFSNRIAPHLGSAAATPRLMRFLEFSVIMNVFSLAASVFIFAFSRIRRTLPPWASLIRISAIVNQVLCIFHSQEDEENVEKAGSAGSFQKDWTMAFTAVHAVAMTAFSVIFVFGYLIIL